MNGYNPIVSSPVGRTVYIGNNNTVYHRVAQEMSVTEPIHSPFKDTLLQCFVPYKHFTYIMVKGKVLTRLDNLDVIFPGNLNIKY